MISIIVFAKSAARALLTAVVSTATIVLTILASTFSPVNAQSYGRIGDLVSFADGSKGVLIHVERDGKSGWAIALQDANNAAALEWAPGKENATQAFNKTLKQENPAYRTLDDLLPLLQDTAGYATTKAIRSAAGGKKEAFPAAFAVDFDNGWYLPSAGQMFSAFAVEPFVKKTLEENGGKALDGMYWTSTPHSEKAAWFVDKLLGVFDYPGDQGLKANLYHVRAMRLWKASTSTYTIAFDGNGATSGTMGNVLVEVGKTTTLPPNAYARAGYVFLGWSERKDASVATYVDRQPNVNLAGAKDETKTLYAIWGKTGTYTIAFDGNGATSGTMGNVLVEVGKTTTLPPNAYARAGYVFLGWSERKDASVATYIDRQPNVDLAGAKDETKTLYAIWGKTDTYTIAFDGNGATSGTMGNVLVEVGKTTTLPPNAYARAGYVFLGWSERKDASVATYIDRQPNVDLAGAKDETKTLYAVWGKNKETAVESALLAKMQCLPNPFEALLTLTGVDAATKVEVYNILGILVYATDLQSTERIDIPSSAWEHGTYLVRVIAPDGVRVLRTVKM